MHVHLKAIDATNLNAVLALHPAAGQDSFVESVAQCLHEASRRRCWRPVAIFDGETVVGFAMYGFFWEYLPHGRVWLDRLLIDAQYQSCGYGRAAMELLLRRLVTEYRCSRIYLSVYPQNSRAIALYQSLGFCFNGQKDIHGEDVMVWQK